MKFRRSDLGHRKLLARAVNDWVNRKGYAEYSTINPENSLFHILKEKFGALGKATLQTIRHNPESDNYPPIINHIAEFMEQGEFFPPGNIAEKTLELLPAFYEGFEGPADRVMNQIDGEYIKYRRSHTKPGFIVGSLINFGRVDDLRFSSVRESIRIDDIEKTTRDFTGIAFADRHQMIIAILREENFRYPKFMMLDDLDRECDLVDCLRGRMLTGLPPRYGAQARTGAVFLLRKKQNTETLPLGLIPETEYKRLPKRVVDFLTGNGR